MVLRASEAEHTRMLSFMAGPVQNYSFVVGNDPNTQSVWRQFYPSVHELPVSYNTFKNTLLRRVCV